MDLTNWALVYAEGTRFVGRVVPNEEHAEMLRLSDPKGEAVYLPIDGEQHTAILSPVYEIVRVPVVNNNGVAIVNMFQPPHGYPSVDRLTVTGSITMCKDLDERERAELARAIEGAEAQARAKGAGVVLP